MIFIFCRFRLSIEFGNVLIWFIYLNRLERHFLPFKLISVIKENSSNPIILGSPLFIIYLNVFKIFYILETIIEAAADF